MAYNGCGFTDLRGSCTARRSRREDSDVRGSLGLLVWSALGLKIGVLRCRLLRRDFELEPAIVVGLDGGRNVEVGERNLLRPLIENVHGLAHDGVVAHFP